MNALRPSAILVVDDDLDHARIAEIVLRSIAPGVPVARCTTTRAAIAALDALPRGTLVLLDRLLGGVESFAAVVALRARRPDLAIVMLSAALSSVDRAYAIACGAHDAIEKPASLAGWRTALGALVAVSDGAPGRRSPNAA